ncbi:MAG TPA: hypothetical protein VES20_21230 [Bryobacteraceae bacterium]|nr:hypothetical protein [Bryobacteraceae bacterium]
MSEDKQLQELMAELRSEDAARSASPFCETRLRAAFRARQAVPKRRSLWKGWAAGLAATAAAAALIAVRLTNTPPVSAPPAVTQAPAAAARPPVQPEPRAVVPQVQVARRAPASSRRKAESVPVIPASSRPDQAAENAFVMLPYAPPLSNHSWSQVMRVRVPRQSLRSLGLPVNEERLFERVPADLLLGEDGVPRAIRIVNSSTR